MLGAEEILDSSNLEKLRIEVLGNNNIPKDKDEINTIPEAKIKAEKISVSARGAAIIDSASEKVLFGQNENDKLPIASITKIVTAMVFLDFNLDWEKEIIFKPEDVVLGGRINILPGEKVKIKDLFYLSLVGSDNSATKALANSTGLNEKEFAEKMNEKAAALGLAKTSFTDCVGLGNDNISTAIEIAKVIKKALSYEEITKATLTESYTLNLSGGKSRIVYNTDKLLKIFPEDGLKLLIGKTGYTQTAGYCFAGSFENNGGKIVIAVVLGSDNINSRFSETKKLANWAYGNYVWK